MAKEGPFAGRTRRARASCPCHRRVDAVQLQPGDRVLLSTDGVTEAEAPGVTRFGQERFTDFIIRAIAAGEPAPEALRRLVNNILAYQDGHLTDDATILVFEWHPTRT
ncbi:MAG TPA: PP2C family protein-serine/threonine phosphatase [Spirillospora sp.]|nr:PP2C family protein-serine/threonine phosphatase [Spirillospora sp.]